MSNEDAPFDELSEERHDFRGFRRTGDHTVGDPGKPDDERLYPASRIDERSELVHHPLAHHLERPDLGDGSLLRRRPRGLNVEDDVRCLVERQRGHVGRAESALLPEEAWIIRDQLLDVCMSSTVEVR